MHIRALFCISFAVIVGFCRAGDVPLKNAGFETGNLDGWDRATPEAAFAVSETGAHSGGFSLRCSGVADSKHNAFCHAVQALEVEPIPGARYRVSGWVRGTIRPGEKKSARLAVRQVDAEDKTIRYAEIWLRPDADEWTAVTKVFRAETGAVRFQIYVILSNLTEADVVYVDDINFLDVDNLGPPISVVPLPFPAVRGTRPGRMWTPST